MTDTKEIVSEYADWLGAWAAAKTVRARKVAAEVYLRDCGGLDGVNARTLQQFIAKPKRDGSPKKTWTKSTYYGHMKSLCEFLVAAGHLAENPMDGARSVKRPQMEPRPLSETDVARVLAVAQGDERDWIVVALNTGLRVSEIAKLRAEDVTTDGVYVDGKGGVAVTLPAHPDVLAIAARKPDHGYWWPGNDEGHIPSQNISRRVGDLFTSLAIGGSIHRCRHTFGTRLLRDGTNVRVVQRLMRHASLETTAGYTAVGEDELTSAVVRLPRTDVDQPNPAA